MPEPKTKRALLPHAVTGAVVWHDYIASVRRTVPERRYTERDGVEQVLPGGPVWFHIFESQDKDPSLRAKRVWGCDLSEAGGEP